MLEHRASPVFVVGCPRSGTSLLRNLLNSHPRLALPFESHFIPRLYRAAGDPRSPDEAVRLAGVIARLWWVARWDLPVSPERFADCCSFADVVDRLFSAWATSKGKPRWGDKTPHYALEIPLLLELFPEAKVLHIIRDGRDVALSWIPKHFGPGNTVSAALEWRRFVLAGRAAARALPETAVLELRYEALTSAPEPTMRAVCEFIGEDFDPAVLAPALDRPVARKRIFGHNPVGHALMPRVVSANSGHWRSRFGERDRSRFEWIAGDLLRDLGYPVEGLARPLSAVELAAWRLHDMASWFVDRLNTAQKRHWLMTELSIRWEGLRHTLRSSRTATHAGSEPSPS